MSSGENAYLGEARVPGLAARNHDLPVARSFQTGSDFSVTPTSSRRAHPGNRQNAITLVLEAASSAHDLAYPSDKFELSLAPTAIFSLSAAPPRLEVFAIRCRKMEARRLAGVTPASRRGSRQYDSTLSHSNVRKCLA